MEIDYCKLDNQKFQWSLNRFISGSVYNLILIGGTCIGEFASENRITNLRNAMLRYTPTYFADKNYRLGKHPFNQSS